VYGFTRKTSVALAAISIAAAGLAPLAHAGPAWEFSSATSYNNGYSYNDGINFETNGAAVDVVALGFYYDPSQPWTSDHVVTLYTSDGTLVATADVTASDPTIGNFKYASIPTISLNGSYQIDGANGPDAWTYGTDGYATDASITVTGNIWILGSDPTFQTGSNPPYTQDGNTNNINDVSNGYFGPDFLVPEPASIALLGVGLISFSAMRRRKAR
jgi:hypothetical protein